MMLGAIILAPLHPADKPHWLTETLEGFPNDDAFPNRP